MGLLTTEEEDRLTDIETAIRRLQDDLSQLRGDGGVAGPMNGDLDMAGHRVVNAEQSNEQTDYVTREELSGYVNSNGVGFETITGVTGVTLTLNQSATSLALFRNGAVLEPGASGNLGYTFTTGTDTITLNRAAVASDFFLVIRGGEIAL